MSNAEKVPLFQKIIKGRGCSKWSYQSSKVNMRRWSEIEEVSKTVIICGISRAIKGSTVETVPNRVIKSLERSVVNNCKRLKKVNRSCGLSRILQNAYQRANVEEDPKRSC
jgi:hypothetical protein